MANYYVRSNSSHSYRIEAEHHEIKDGILYFFDVNDNPVWVIKDWVSITCSVTDEDEKKTPDEFYESLKEDE